MSTAYTAAVQPRWATIAAFLLMMAPVQAEDTPASVQELPPFQVTPMIDPMWESDLQIGRIAETLPDMGGDGPRIKLRSEKLLEGLGLIGPGIEALSEAEQAAIGNLLDSAGRLNAADP